MCNELRTFATILLPPRHGVRLTHVTVEKTSIRLQLTAIAPTAACPLCGLPSSAIHSRYQRRLTDLPWGTRTVHFDVLFWGLIWLGTASIIIFPEATSSLAHLLGIGWGADLIMYLSLLVSFYLIFRLYLALARLEQAITALVRAIVLEQLPESVDSSSGRGD
jgi:hypothetical protein